MQNLIQKSSRILVMQLGFKIQRFLYKSISIAVNEAKVTKHRLAMATTIPKACPNGPVQHLMVIGATTQISFKPKLMKKADMA